MFEKSQFVLIRGEESETWEHWPAQIATVQGPAASPKAYKVKWLELQEGVWLQ